MQNQHEYKASIKEIHHTEKLDIPSGTSLILKSQIKNSIAYKVEGLKILQEFILSTMIQNIDDLSITHKAHNRNGFAKGPY